MNEDIIGIASVVGSDWTDGQYYSDAEGSMASQWSNLIWPIISSADLSRVVEIAAGHGRNTAELASVAGAVIATDINQTNVDFLKRRFVASANVTVARNSGADLREIPSASISFVYSFDAMVHFDSDVIRSYIKEIRRILQPGGTAFCHYSAYDKNPTGTYRDHPGWRNFMSQELFEHWLTKEGLSVISSTYVEDVLTPSTSRGSPDSITYFQLPSDALPAGPFVDEAITARAAQLSAVRAELTSVNQALSDIHSSTSWRLTAPVRRLISLFRS